VLQLRGQLFKDGVLAIELGFAELRIFRAAKEPLKNCFNKFPGGLRLLSSLDDLNEFCLRPDSRGETGAFALLKLLHVALDCSRAAEIPFGKKRNLVADARTGADLGGVCVSWLESPLSPSRSECMVIWRPFLLREVLRTAGSFELFPLSTFAAALSSLKSVMEGAEDKLDSKLDEKGSSSAVEKSLKSIVSSVPTDILKPSDGGHEQFGLSPWDLQQRSEWELGDRALAAVLNLSCLCKQTLSLEGEHRDAGTEGSCSASGFSQRVSSDTHLEGRL